MSEAFNAIIAAQGNALNATLKRINEAVDGACDPDREVYRDDIFADKIIEILMQQSVLALPESAREGEYFARHRFSARVNRGDVTVWGSALVRNGDDDSFTLHIFATDYDARGTVEELEEDECGRLLRAAFQFYRKSADGSFVRQVNQQHPAWRCANAIFEARDRIIAVKCWLLSSRVLGSSVNAGRGEKTGVEVTQKVIDLQEIAKILEEKSGIPQDFSGIGGLPCFVTKTESQSYECIQTVFTGTVLAELYSIHSTSLVEANVRAYLGDNKINKGIRDTIEDEPGNFLAFNNGLVISAASARVEGGRLMHLDGIQIVNGGQTTASIYQTWLTARNNHRDPEKRERIARNLNIVRVPAKIIVPPASMTEDEKLALMKGISVAANSQNKVNLSDLSANSRFQTELYRTINGMMTPSGDYWFYEKSRGLYNAELRRLTGDKAKTARFRQTYPSAKKIDKTDIALASLCWDGMARECALGKEKAFAIFEDRAERLCVKDEEVKLTREEAQRLISKWIIFSRLQEAVRKDKSLGITNPRVPVIYAIALFAKKYGPAMRWDTIWNRQDVSESFINEMKKLAATVFSIMKANMGNYMVAMWGRQPACMRTLEANFSFGKCENLHFEYVYEISR